MAVVRMPDRTVHALAFAETAVTLMRAAGGGWTVVERVAVTEPDFANRMTGLAKAFGHPAVVLWLPPEHVLSLRLPEGEQDARAALAGRPGIDPESLTLGAWVGTPPPGGLALAADTDVIGEAIGFARGWGFRPQAVSVNPAAIPPGCTLRFPHAELPQPPKLRTVAGLAAAVAVAAGLAIWGLWPATEAPPSLVQSAVPPAAVDETPPHVAASAPILTRSPLASAAAPERIGLDAGTITAPAPITRGSLDTAQPPAPEPPRPQAAQRPEPDTPPVARLAGLAPALHGDLAALLPRLPNEIAAEARPPAAPQRPAAPAPGETPPRHDRAPDTPPAADAPPSPEAAPAETAAGGAADRSDEAGAPPMPPVRAVEGPPRLAAVLPPQRPVAAEAEPAAEAEGPRMLRAPRPTLRPARPVAVAPAPERTPAASTPAAQARRTLSATGARTASVTANPEDVSRLATIRGALPAGQAGLIGVFGEGPNRQALLRLPNGRIQRVNRGDRVEGWTVSAIDDNSVRLSGPSGGRTLQVPSR